MMKKIFAKILISAVLSLVAVAPMRWANAHEDHAQTEEVTAFDTAIIYYNEACAMCATYIKNDLPQDLAVWGISNFVKKDYVNEKTNRVAMNDMMRAAGVPLDLQSHIMTFIGEKYILGGHIPKTTIDEIFLPVNAARFKKIMVYQDEMHSDAKDYKIWAMPTYADDFVGEAKTYPINTGIGEYLDYLEKNKDTLINSTKVNDKLSKYKSLLPVVLVSGFLDGINPCAFAVLLFFIAFLFSLKKTRGSIWKMGLVYIGAIYLAYFLIGLGITKALLFANAPHFMAELGAWLVIILGVINLLGILFPSFPIKLKIPAASKETLQNWMHKATLPAAFVLGFLVGLCTFPCSGGIYVAIIGLLAARTTYFTGLGFLILYNIMFVVPLFIILLLSSNKYAVEKLARLEQTESKHMKLISAFTMIALGAIILVFFT